jgi:hypothetical protein
MRDKAEEDVAGILIEEEDTGEGVDLSTKL